MAAMMTNCNNQTAIHMDKSVCTIIQWTAIVDRITFKQMQAAPLYLKPAISVQSGVYKVEHFPPGGMGE